METNWAPTLPHPIDDMIKIHPLRLAVKDGVGHAFTYTQFAQRVSDIARALIGAGAEEGSKVAIFQEPTANWICCLLAILRIGAVYVPLDLRNPLERLAAIVKTAEPSAILAHTPTLGAVPGLGGTISRTKATVIDVSSIALPFVDCKLERIVPIKARPNSPAVILFTSGTTGSK
jgi:hybrid polyketide synthase/nonribosomal peptide synthetase ACE1